MTVWRIPDGITEITNEYVRDNMPEGTTEVVIPEGVERIGSDVFSGCRALNSIVLPDTLVDNRVRYAITANQTVIKYSDFNDWKYKNGLEGKSYPDQAILFLYQLQNIESFKPSWSEVLKQCPEVSVHDLLKFADKKPVCMPKFFLSDGDCDLEGKIADAEQSNPCFKVSIDGNDCPGFADALLQNLSLFDGTSFFCTAIDKHFRSHQSGDSLEDTLRP